MAMLVGRTCQSLSKIVFQVISEGSWGMSVTKVEELTLERVVCNIFDKRDVESR